MLRLIFAVAVLQLRILLNIIKVKLGLAREQYGICNPFTYKGVLYGEFYHSPERNEACGRYDHFRPGDVIVATYPKSGTHFVFDILGSIYKEKGLIAKDASSIDYTASLEIHRPLFMAQPPNNTDKPEGAIQGIEGPDPKSPRIIGSHLHWSCFPPKVREGKVKVIHCMRNPKDVLCSMYPFYKKVGYTSSSVKWDDFVQWFIEGNVVNGSYFQFLKDWYPHRNQPNLLNLHYEDMKKSLRENVVKIAEFLNMELTDKQIDAVVAANTFESRKKVEGDYNPMYRKGKAGGWRSDVTVEQNAMLNEWIQQEMEGLPDLNIQYD